MNTDTVTGTKVEGYDEAVAHGPGAFYFRRAGTPTEGGGVYKYDTLFVIVPGDTTPRGLPVNSQTGWKWDGNEDAPTLDPSIGACDETGAYTWHGFLLAGVFESQ